MTGRVHRARQGFTLIEVMVASLLLVLLLGGVYTTFSAGRRSTLIVERRGDMQQTARAILDRMTAELNALYVEPPPLETQSGAGGGGDGSGEPAEGAGEAEAGLVADETEEEVIPPLLGSAAERGLTHTDLIEFTSAVGPRRRGPQPPTTLARIRYYLDVESSTRESGLIRAENRYLDLTDDESAWYTEQLSDLVESLNFRYHDAEQEDWVEEWNQEALPVAIEITMVVRDAEGEEEPVTVSAVVTVRLLQIRPIGEALGSQRSSAQGEAQPQAETPSQGQDQMGMPGEFSPDMFQFMDMGGGAGGGGGTGGFAPPSFLEGGSSFAPPDFLGGGP